MPRGSAPAPVPSMQDGTSVFPASALHCKHRALLFPTRPLPHKRPAVHSFVLRHTAHLSIFHNNQSLPRRWSDTCHSPASKCFPRSVPYGSADDGLPSRGSPPAGTVWCKSLHQNSADADTVSADRTSASHFQVRCRCISDVSPSPAMPD